MNTHVMAEGPQYGSGNDSMAALSQVSGGNHTYAGSSQDQLNDREASFPYGYNYTPTGTPTHSYSTADRTSEHPSLMRDSTARASVRKGGKLVPLKVQMLDDSVIALHVPNGCLGADLFKECCRHLNLLEMDYFGLEYFNKTDKVVWLDLEKPIARQVAAPKKTLFHFTVKFYLADPSQLQDEFTKYLYALQIKKDLANGRLPCSENTAALMASYMLQAEVGDYTSPDHDDGRYISAFRFVPNQTRAMESKIQEYHKNHVGQTPADADFNLLDVARRLEMYGVQLHAARDYENVQLHLAVSHQGVLVFHNNSRINTFSWAKIRKLSFKRKRFLVKLHPEGFGYPRSTVEFMMTSRNDCKRFWKCCVEHHTFFRLTQPKHGRRPRRRLLSRGSTFRYSGRTQKQVVEDARVTYIQRPGFGPSLARVSTRSLGAPRTTTPLTINLTESIVPDHHSAPDLTYGQSYANGQGDNAVSSPTSVSPTTPSSTPVTPVHDNSRIAIHKGQSNSSITYEYTVNEDNPQMQSSSEVNGDSEPVHILPTESAPTEAAPQEEPKVQPEPQPEKEVQSPVINGEHNGHEGLSTNYSTDTSDISIPSGSLHIDVDYEMRRQVILDLPDEIERLEDPFVEEEGPKRERHESGSSSSSSGSHSIEDGEGLEYEEEIQTEEGFDLEILEGIGGPTLSEFDENGRAKRMGFPDTGKKFDMREARAKFEVLESLQMPVTSDPEDESPTKSVEAEVGSVGSGTSGELLGSMQAAASNGSTSSDELNFVRTERASTEIRLSNTIDEVLKIAAELASPTDEPYTPSFESRSLDSFLNEEGSDVGQKGFDITPEDDSANPKNYSSFMKERQLVFDDSSDESDDSSLGAKLGETNKNLTNLEENLDETSADLRLLEESLAETRKSLKAMEHDVLSDTSTESPVFPAFDTDQQNEIELTPESPCRDTPVFSTPSDSLTEDIINANTPEPIAEAKITPQNDSQTKQAPLDEADLARALTPAALESHNLKRLHDMPPPPTPPPTPKVSVVDSPTHIPKISTVELHKITSFDDMMPPPPPRAHSNPSTGKVKNIAHMLPDLPPPPPLPLSPPPDSPPPCPSPLSPPHATIMKYTFNYDIQRPPPPVPVVKAAPPARPPKPKPIKVDSRKFEDAEKSPVPPTPPPRMESKQPKIKPQFDFRHSSGVTRVQSSSYHAHVSVQQTTSSVVTKKEAGVQMSGFSEVQRSEFSESRTVKAVTTTKHETAETQRSTLECMLENQEVSSIERPPPPIVSLNPQQKSDEVSETVDTIVITPESNEMRLTRPGTFVTELKMIVRPGKIHVSDSRSKRECSNNQDKSFKSSEISKGSPESSSNWNNSSNLVSSDNRKSSSKRESMESTDSDDSARQEFRGRSLDDLLNSPDIVGYPTPDDDDSTRGLAEESYLLQGDLRYSETSSTTSGSSDDSCVYHYQVAEAQMTKVKGEAPLAKADDSGSSSDDDSNSSTSTEENGLLNRHAMGNGGIVLTNAVTEAPGLFSDLQDVASPLSALSDSPVLSPTGGKAVPAFPLNEEPAPPAPVEEDSGVRKKRHPPDRAYFIAKEILTTERTYLKDLEVIVVWFRKSTTNETSLPDILETLFSSLDPIYEFHCKFLKEIETRLTSWEGRTNLQQKGSFQRVGDIMLKNVQHLKLYQGYVEKLQGILQELESSTRKNKKFESFYKDFELQKVCYLPFNTFLVKPMQRLLHYQLILERLIKHYPSDHPDYKDCKAAVSEVNELTAVVTDNMKTVENYQKLAELQRDLVGFDSLLLPGRNKPLPLVRSKQHFIREGCLHKLSRKGYQQRMFFLFSDILVYTSKGVTPTNQFKVHGQIPLKGVVLEDSEHDRSVANCFTLYGTNKTVVIAASTPEEKDRWMGDLRTAMALASNNPHSPESSSTLSDPESSTHEESEDDVASPTKSVERQSHHRANTTVHVCWHRNTSISMADHVRAMENQLSGFLLRKFKNSNGWQKLWVVFTNFCLFFYKSHQDDYPLASLPLLGYSIMFPTEEDDIRKDYVFKLQFKTHVYFFRAESEYTFSRWLEVLKSATYSSKVEDLF